MLKAGEVGRKIAECDGNLAAVARSFGVSRQSVHEFVGKRAALQSACRDARESMKDEAESSLYRALRAGEAWAVCFYLKTQAKDRGYVERSEVTGAEGGPIQFVDVVRPEGADAPSDDDD